MRTLSIALLIFSFFSNQVERVFEGTCWTFSAQHLSSNPSNTLGMGGSVRPDTKAGIHGFVQDELGRGLPGVSIAAFKLARQSGVPTTTDDQGAMIASTTSCTNGEYFLTGFTVGGYAIKASQGNLEGLIEVKIDDETKVAEAPPIRVREGGRITPPTPPKPPKEYFDREINSAKELEEFVENRSTDGLRCVGISKKEGKDRVYHFTFDRIRPSPSPKLDFEVRLMACNYTSDDLRLLVKEKTEEFVDVVKLRGKCYLVIEMK